MMRRTQQDRILNELSSLVLSLLRTDQVSNGGRNKEITAGGIAWLMLGVSMALMMCGTVTFFIGFMMMPWVLGLVMVFYVVGIVSTISMLGRSLFSYALPPTSNNKDHHHHHHHNIPAWKLL